jgi:hypothetical protein
MEIAQWIFDNIEAIEKSFKGKYKGHEHTRGYPIKGVSKIVW